MPGTQMCAEAEDQNPLGTPSSGQSFSLQISATVIIPNLKGYFQQSLLLCCYLVVFLKTQNIQWGSGVKDCVMVFGYILPSTPESQCILNCNYPNVNLQGTKIHWMLYNTVHYASSYFLVFSNNPLQGSRQEENLT